MGFWLNYLWRSNSFWAEKPEHLSDFEDPSISPLQDIWVVFCSAHAAWILLPVFLVPVGGLAANYDRHLQQERGTKMSKACWNFIFTKFFRGSENISPGIFEYYLNNKTHFVLGKKSVENFPRNFFSKSPRVTLLVSPDWRLDNDSKQEFFLLKKDFLPVPIAECVLVLLPPCCCRILLRADGDKSIMKFDRMISLDFEDPTTLDPCALKERSDIWWKKHQKTNFSSKRMFFATKTLSGNITVIKDSQNLGVQITATYQANRARISCNGSMEW